MTMVKTLVSALIASATAFGVAAPAQAVITTFASFSPIGSAPNVRWVNAGTGGSIGSTATGSSVAIAPRSVSFSFLLPALAPFFTGVTASFTLSATAPSGNPAASFAGFLVQEGIAGSFSFLSTSAITIGSTTYAVGSNLLSASFGATSIGGQRNSTSAGFNGSTAAGDTLVYTSDFLSFVNVADSDFAISLSSVTPALNAVPTNGTPTAALRTFRAVASGTFSTDPAPIVTAIPEPAVWGLMIAGFGLIGVQARRRKRAEAVVA